MVTIEQLKTEIEKINQGCGKEFKPFMKFIGNCGDKDAKTDFKMVTIEQLKTEIEKNWELSAYVRLVKPKSKDLFKVRR